MDKEKKASNIKLNYLYNVAYQILLVIAPLIVSPYISRVLGSENIGIYSYTYSIAYYFALLCALGVRNHGSRSIAECRDDEEKKNNVFSEICSLQLYISALVIIVYALFIVFAVKGEYKLYFVLQILYILSCALDINWLYFGLEEFKITVTRKVIIKLLSIFSIVLFVKTKEHLVVYTLIMGVSYLVGELYLWLFVKHKVKFKFLPISRVITHLKPMIILFVPLLAVSLYRMMDKVMLGATGNMNGVGQYENAEKIIMVLLGFVSALGTVMLPRMAKLNVSNDKNQIQKYLNNSMRFMMLFACAVTGGLFAIGKDFAPIFFGNEFVECGKILQVLSISVIFIAWSNVLRTQYLIPCHKDKIYIIGVWIGAIINFGINLILIPSYGALGAAVATVITEFMVAITQTSFIYKSIKVTPFIKDLFVCLALGSVMSAAVYLTGTFINFGSIANLTIQVILGIIIYCTFAFVYLLAVDKDLIIGIINRIKAKITSAK